MKDPLALWRNKDPLTLAEAAAVLCECPPGREYDRSDAAERREDDMIAEVGRQLAAAARAGEMAASIEVKHVRRAVADSPTQLRISTSHEPAKQHIDLHASRVTRADLKAWCDTQQLRPSIFYPCIQRDASPPVDPPREDEAGGIAEANADKALAVMAWLLSRQAMKFKNGDKPNQARIAMAVEPLAKEHFGDDVRGFDAFHKRLARALRTFPEG